MHAFDVLGDPVRRRILEMLADGELSAGEIGAAIREEFGISQPAVSQHLRILREGGFASVRPEGTRRLYRLDDAGIEAVREYLEQVWGEAATRFRLLAENTRERTERDAS